MSVAAVLPWNIPESTTASGMELGVGRKIKFEGTGIMSGETVKVNISFVLGFFFCLFFIRSTNVWGRGEEAYRLFGGGGLLAASAG